MAGVGLRMDVRGLRECVAAAQRLPKDARDEAREGANDIAKMLADEAKAAGRSDTRQSARAASTVRASRGIQPGVLVGPHKLLFGSEFGATRRFGWYAKGRYRGSSGKQFRPHRGSGSYWFFRSISENQPAAIELMREHLENVARRWGEG